MERTILNPVLKHSITYLQTAADTNGKITELELILSPGGGNPRHFHKTYSETFVAIEGYLTLEINGKEIMVLKPGQSYTVPPYQVHKYFNNSDTTVIFKVTVEPAHEGFEFSLRIGYGLAAEGLANSQGIPKSLKQTAVLLFLGDINFAGMTSLLSPFLRYLGKGARKSGLEQSLIYKYCR